MKSITIVAEIVILLTSGAFAAHPGEAFGSEKRVQEFIKQLDSRAWDEAVRELVRILRRPYRVESRSD